MIWYKFYEAILNSPAKRNKVVMANFFSALIINIAIWTTLIVAFWRSTEYIVLKYNIYFGISAFGPWYGILIIPATGLLVILINFSLSFVLYLKEQILSYSLAFSATIFNLLTLVAVLVLYYINV